MTFAISFALVLAGVLALAFCVLALDASRTAFKDWRRGREIRLHRERLVVLKEGYFSPMKDFR
jgi:uncharacterized membrane protein YsdA (DUF1294 family)